MIRPLDTARKGHNTTLPGSNDAFANRQKNRQQSGEERDAGARDAKNAKGFARDGRNCSDRHGADDASLFHGGTLFEKELRLAKRHHSQDQLDEDQTSQDQTIQILYDTGHAMPGAGASNTLSEPPRHEGRSRAAEIVNQLAMRIVSECRTGPLLGSGPVTITIPLEQVGTGIDRIEIRLDDGTAMITLCLSDAREASQHLIGAASQLGRLLQDHLPGRRIKIARSSPDLGTTDDSPSGDEVTSTHFQHLFRR